MRTSKLLFKIISFLIVIILINNLLVFLLKPYLGSSAEMWTLYKQKEDLTLIYTGSSQCIAGIRPDYVDSASGYVSYNMGTNMQSVHNSKRAIEKAIKEHDIKVVFAVIDFQTLSMDRYSNYRAEASFQSAENSIEDPLTRITNTIGFVTDPEIIGTPGSVNFFFPWVYDRNTDIATNVKEKLSGQVLDASKHRDLYGFESSDEVMDSNLISITLEEAREWSNNSTAFQDLYITDSVRKSLKEMAEVCRENNVRLVAASIPYANHFSVYRLDDYQAVTNELTEIFSGDNCAYYDFNLIKPEYFEIKSSYYRDVGHLNTEGATAFSTFLGEFLVTSETTDVSDYFYDINEY